MRGRGVGGAVHRKEVRRGAGWQWNEESHFQGS